MSDCRKALVSPGWGGGAEREARGGEMLPTLAVGWRASALRGEEAGRFREVAGVSIVAAFTEGKSGRNAICCWYIEVIESSGVSSYPRGSIRPGTWFLA